MTVDPIHRGRRWEAFFEEDGGLRDMFETIRTTYLERLSQVEPWETDKLSKLAMAHKITQQVEGMVRSIISNADVQQAARDYADKIEKIPAQKRRYF